MPLNKVPSGSIKEESINAVFTDGEKTFRSGNKPATSVNTMINLLLATKAGVVVLKGFHTAGDGGGGDFYYDPTQDRANHDGGTIVDPTNAADVATWDASAKTTWFTAGTGSGCWMRVYSDSVSVEWFGAKGDFVEDETKSIQAAVDTGVSVFFPKGNYLTDSITLLTNSTLMGVGPFQSIVYANSNSQNIFTLANTTGGQINGVDISNMWINGNSKTSIKGIYMNGTDSSSRISTCSFYNLFVTLCATGIEIFYCANTYVDKVFMNSCVEGIHNNISGDTDLSNMKVQNGTGVGYQITGGAGAFDEGVRMSNCSSNGQNVGITIAGQDWGVASNCSWTTCSGGGGVFTGTSGNWKFSACDFSVAGTTPAAAGVTGGSLCTGYSFTGCNFLLNTVGLVWAGPSAAVVGCYFLGNSSYDIHLNAASFSTIADNICRSTGDTTSILEAGIADNNKINNNLTIGDITIVGDVTSLDNVYYATAVQFAQVGYVVNVDIAKRLGTVGWDTTNNLPVWASGPAAADVWVDGAGTTVYTPV